MATSSDQIPSRSSHPPQPTVHSPRPTSPMSNPRSPRFEQRPIDEAIETAVDKAKSSSSSYVPPELVAQITQNVIKQLQSTGLDTPVQHQQPQFPPPPPSHQQQQPPPPPPSAPPAYPNSDHQSVPLSPSTTASGTSPNAPNRVFTPPSPHKPSDYLGPSSPPLPSNPPFDPSASPSKAHRNEAFSPIRPSSPMSQASNVSDTNGDRPSRPKGPERLHTGMEETTLEKIWGSLFDPDGRATSRLSQFLRGLAVHIIEDYAPRHSLVITPDKMVKYYEEAQIESEKYPWSVVFDDERSSISRMYRELACQHHLIQERHDERPDIPGLTPLGFEQWMTLLIQSNPDAEYERLAKTVLHMPISNPDNRRERFPKEITRRLFPKHSDLDVRYRIEDAMIEHASIEIPRPKRQDSNEEKARQESPSSKTSTEPSQTANPRPTVTFAKPEIIPDSKSSYVPSGIERERKPYSAVPESAVIDDTNPPEPLAPKPIERERKPYVTGNRQYEPEEVRPRDAASRTRSDSIPHNEYKPVRSDSTGARARPIPINPTNNQGPKPEIHQSYRAGSNAGNGRRRRSPSFSSGNDVRRPDIDAHGYRPSFESGSLPRGGGGDMPHDESDTKRYFEHAARERARRKAEEDARAYGESPRRPRESLRPRRAEYGNEEEYWRSRDRRDRSFDDGHRDTYGSSHR